MNYNEIIRLILSYILLNKYEYMYIESLKFLIYYNVIILITCKNSLKFFYLDL